MDYRKLVFDNWVIKLGSFALALTLWFYVTSKGKTEMSLTVPLELRNIPANKAVVGDVAANLDVRVQGQERVLRDITTGKKVVGILDLSSARVGENTLPVSPDNIKRPSGVFITHIAPYEIKVNLEPLVRKTLRLRTVFTGSPAAGFRVTGVSLTPARITLEGPLSVMKTLTAIQTLPVNVKGAKGSFTAEPKIDYQGKPVKILEKSISMKVSIERAGP